MRTSDESNLPPGHYVEHGSSVDQANDCFTFLRSVPILFEIADAALWDLARTAEVVEFSPGERVVAQGSHDRELTQFFVIRSGSADVMRRDKSGLERPIARLSVGSYFGELGLLTNQARNATIRVHGDAPLRAYAFDALTFHRRIAEHVLAFRTLRERSSPLTTTTSGDAIMRPTIASGSMRIKHLDVLDRMPASDLEYILSHAEHRWHPDGSAIIEQGDPGERFYVLLEGEATVSRDEHDLAELGAGDFFGETALLLDMPRTATVRANGNSLTWSITRSAFQRMVGSYLLSNPRTQDEIMRRMAEVLPQTNPVRVDSDEPEAERA